jgi:hypothetical protein
MMRSDVVNAVLEKGEAIVLTDSSKFGAVHPYTMGVGNCFNRVITDAGIPQMRSASCRNLVFWSISSTQPLRFNRNSPLSRAISFISETILTRQLRLFTLPVKMFRRKIIFSDITGRNYHTREFSNTCATRFYGKSLVQAKGTILKENTFRESTIQEKV